MQAIILATGMGKRLGGKEVMLCTTAPDYCGNALDIYTSYIEGCPSVLKPIMKVNSPDKTARNAGLCFRIDSKVYHPAQY